MDDRLRKQAWEYFQLHASQRLTTFNFYLAVCTAIAAGEVASFHREFNFPALRVVFGALLVVFSFVFWKLDERNRLLIKNAEAALKFFEEQDSKEVQPAHVFRREEIITAEMKSQGKWLLSYSVCFRVVFVVFGVIGVLSMAMPFLSGR